MKRQPLDTRLLDGLFSRLRVNVRLAEDVQLDHYGGSASLTNWLTQANCRTVAELASIQISELVDEMALGRIAPSDLEELVWNILQDESIVPPPRSNTTQVEGSARDSSSVQTQRALGVEPVAITNKAIDLIPLRSVLNSLRFAPHWVHRTRLETFHMSARLGNLLALSGYRVLGDVVTDINSLVKAAGFGKVCASELQSLLSTVVSQAQIVDGSWTADGGPFSDQKTGITGFVPGTLTEQLSAFLSRLKPRDAIAFKARFEYDSAWRTYDQIGELLGVTRERARQLAKRATDSFLKSVPRIKEITPILSALMPDRKEPLTVSWLAKHEQLFSGLATHERFVFRLIEEFAQDFYVWPINSELLVARIPETEWKKLQENCKEELDERLTEALTAAQIREVIGNRATAAGVAECAEMLADYTAQHLHFSSANYDASPVLMAVGKGMRGMVRAVMDEAETALPLREIVKRCESRAGRPLTAVGYRNLLNSIGAHVFAGRRYGLEKHLSISTEDQAEILLTAEAVIVSGAGDRQWHCAELIAAIQRERPNLAVEFDPYEMNMLLTKSAKLQPLGRLVWRLGSPGQMSSQNRMSIAELCFKVLNEAGKPLRQRALEVRIRKLRGLNDKFMPQPDRRIARVRPGTWGLVSRDFPFGMDEGMSMLNRLEVVLTERQKALHTSEIANAIKEPTSTPLRLGVALYGLAQTNERFRTGRGHIVGLSRWNTLGRHSARSAIRAAVQLIDSLGSPQALFTKIDKLAERRVARATIKAELDNLGFEYLQGQRRWTRRSMKPSSRSNVS